MYTYLKKDLRGHYLELEEQLPSEQYTNIGTTAADYDNNLWILLSEEQLAFKEQNPNATPKEVINMAITPLPLEAVKRNKLADLSYYYSQHNRNFLLGETNVYLNKSARLYKESEANNAEANMIDSVDVNGVSMEPAKAITLMHLMDDYDATCQEFYSTKADEINSKETAEEVEAVEISGLDDHVIDDDTLTSENKKKDKTDVNRQILKLLRGQVNTMALTDQVALSVKLVYPIWGSEDLPMGTPVKANDKFQYPKGTLYKVYSPHNLQADWIPGKGTESLYVRIDEEHKGTLEDPIPYDGNMILENGKYYSQDGKTYKCIRDTGIAVYDSLATLATVAGGQYVEEVV